MAAAETVVHNLNIWDNFRLFCEHLDQLAAADPIHKPVVEAAKAELEEAAKAVHEAEQQVASESENDLADYGGLPGALRPIETMVGMIDPPSEEALYWARRCVASLMSKGAANEDVAVIAGLWALRRFSVDEGLQAMDAALNPASFLALLPAIERASNADLAEFAVDHYLQLFGLKKKLLKMREIRLTRLLNHWRSWSVQWTPKS